MEFWDGTRYIRHIRRDPPDLPVKTILVLVTGGITATAWLWPAQRHVQLPLPAPCPPTAGAVPTPMVSVPGPVDAFGRLLPPRPGSTAGTTAPTSRPGALRPGTAAPVTTSGPVVGTAGSVPMDAQAVTYAVTPSPSPAPSATSDGPAAVPMMATPSATPSSSPSPSASPTHPGKKRKPSATPSPDR